MAEPIEISFGKQAESLVPKEPCIRWEYTWRNLANTTERSVLGGDTDCRYRYCSKLFSYSTQPWSCNDSTDTALFQCDVPIIIVTPLN